MHTHNAHRPNPKQKGLPRSSTDLSYKHSNSNFNHGTTCATNLPQTFPAVPQKKPQKTHQPSPTVPYPASTRNWGICVVFPEPVSPSTTTVWLSFTCRRRSAQERRFVFSDKHKYTMRITVDKTDGEVVQNGVPGRQDGNTTHPTFFSTAAVAYRRRAGYGDTSRKASFKSVQTVRMILAIPGPSTKTRQSGSVYLLRWYQAPLQMSKILVSRGNMIG